MGFLKMILNKLEFMWCWRSKSFNTKDKRINSYFSWFLKLPVEGYLSEMANSEWNSGQGLLFVGIFLSIMCGHQSSNTIRLNSIDLKIFTLNSNMFHHNMASSELTGCISPIGIIFFCWNGKLECKVYLCI